jgi:hypothetical protein
MPYAPKGTKRIKSSQSSVRPWIDNTEKAVNGTGGRKQHIFSSVNRPSLPLPQTKHALTYTDVNDYTTSNVSRLNKKCC